ncbi:MAG: ABC transporter ATP-binding protein [Clostridia bacterium]|nr:ABC transporter ATP-binding protein [Clostridia bacterium]
MLFGKRIGKYYLRYSWLLILGIAALVAVDYFQLRIPEIYGAIIDGLDPTTTTTITTDMLLNLLYEAFWIVAVLAVGRFLWRVAFFCSANNTETRFRAAMFDHAKDLSQQYYKQNKVGNIMSLFTNDLETINECFGDGTLMLFDALLLGIMAIYKMAVLNWKLTLFALIPMAFLASVGVIMCKYMTKKWDERQDAFSQLSDFAQENFSGIAVIKAFVKEMKELSAFKYVNKHNEDVNVSFVKASVLLDIMVSLFIGSVVTIVIGYGGWLAHEGTFILANEGGETSNVAALVMFISYFSTITWPVMAIAMLIEMTSRGQASLKRINEFLDTPIDVKDREGVRDIEDVKGEIEFRNLTFKYPDGDRDVLKNVSFKINAGENVGIIGKTGAGKSTVVDLMLRTYNIDDGTFFLDGQDVNDLSIRSVRSAMAYVPQDNFLFSDTIASNISFAYGENDVDKQEIEEVAKLADIHGDVSAFKDGYETILGERGVTISGGQKQRTSIARALMKHAAILILDDSLSAVDTKTEENILEGLKKNRAGKTTIYIAHRISTVKNLDKIILIDDGEVVDIGTHYELMSRCAEYQKTVKLQELEEESEGGAL